MLKVKKITPYTRGNKRSIWRRALNLALSAALILILSGCGGEVDPVDYETLIQEYEQAINNLNNDLTLKNKEIEDLSLAKEDLKKENSGLKEENDSLKGENQALKDKIDTLNEDPALTDSLPKDTAYRIFYDEEGTLDVDGVTEAFQFSGVEDWKYVGATWSMLEHLDSVNMHKMGDYFVVLTQNGTHYLASANDYTKVYASGFGDPSTAGNIYANTLYQYDGLEYCPHYDSKNGGIDSPDGNAGYILELRDRDGLSTLYDFDTFEVLARDCSLYNNRLSWQLACKEGYIEPYKTESGKEEGAINYTVITKNGVNYMVDLNTFEVLAIDVKRVDCKMDEAGVRIITITHSDDKTTIYLNDAIKPLETDVLTRKLVHTKDE